MKSRYLTISEIKEKFPDPLSREEGGDYDVGKAFLLYTKQYDVNDEMYPSEEDIAEGLLKVNPKLSHTEAFEAACEIVLQTDVYNDHEAAWDALEEALVRN